MARRADPAAGALARAGCRERGCGGRRSRAGSLRHRAAAVAARPAGTGPAQAGTFRCRGRRSAAEGGWTVIRRSRVSFEAPLDENADVLVLDSIGELAGLYPLADAVFVGGSLVPAGGHNILEPAWFSKPPVFGTSMENFRDMSDQFLAAKAGVQVSSGQQLGKVWVQLIEDNRFAGAHGPRRARTLRAQSRRHRARHCPHYRSCSSNEAQRA